MRMEKYKCKECGETFLHQDTMFRHMKKVHSITHQSLEGVPVMCTICGNVHPSQWAYDLHMRRVHGGPKECPQCGKVLKNQSSLQGHMKSQHTERVRHKCTKCDASYPEKYRLYLHVRKVHEGISLWLCKLCNKGYNARSDGAIHIGTVHEKFSSAEAKKNFRDFMGHPALIRNPLSAKTPLSVEG